MSIHDETNIVEWQKMAIANRDERIKLLESAIREFLKCDLRCELSSFNHESCEGEDELRYIARTNLEKLIENKS